MAAEDVFFFVNPKSGGNKGEVFLEAPQPFLVPVASGQTVNVRIFSILEGEAGNKPGFKQLKQACTQRGGPVTVILGGGDGTVMWGDTECTKHGIDTATDVIFGIVPLGTGNDFSRVAGWGGTNPSKVKKDDWQWLKTKAQEWKDAVVRPHDVWQVELQVDEARGQIRAIKDKQETPDDALTVVRTMINYFSIGQDSKAGMSFETHRTKSQFMNLVTYALAGCCAEVQCCTAQHIGSIVDALHHGPSAAGPVVMDSDEGGEGPQIVGHPECLVFLNINSYAGGNAHFWDDESDDYGVTPAPRASDVGGECVPGDGRMEVVTVPRIADIALDRAHHAAKKVFSGTAYHATFVEDADEDVEVYCEVDGEFFHLVNPETATITHKKRLQVLQNSEEIE